MVIQAVKSILKSHLPDKVYTLLVVLHEWRDFVASIRFLAMPCANASFVARLRLLLALYKITFSIDCPHAQWHVLSFVRLILALPRGGGGVVVETGCFKGGSTAKFSLAAELAGRRLYVFDSFEGIPPNCEDHGRSLGGAKISFAEGSYRGSLDEVRNNVQRFGCIKVCTFVRGWFDETLPAFQGAVAALYIDVDLASSTKCVLENLWPKIEQGGTVLSQDGHLPLVVSVLGDNQLWQEVGESKPKMVGLGTSKLVSLMKG